ncbi:MAG: CHAT domain-containing protein [Burkholderiales bacterium]|nr:MAG: CHAT domain-containing protein [Burkholderiales bacterium]
MTRRIASRPLRLTSHPVAGMPQHYLDFDLRLYGHECLPDGREALRVLVLRSPTGEALNEERAELPADLRPRLALLEKRQLNGADMVALGRALGAALLPQQALTQFMLSQARLTPEQGLRITLQCSGPELDALPWELAHLDLGLQGAPADLRGFVTLNRRLSLVRYELGSQLMARPQRSGGPRRIVAVLCEPDNLKTPGQPLQVDAELAEIRAAVERSPGVELSHCADATLNQLQRALDDGADVFHFAGHGEFLRNADGTGHGALMLLQDGGQSHPWTTDSVALNLADKGIQLAVLSACRSAQGDGRNPWAGVAPSLARAGVPAVIGMQYTVFDESALTFSRRFYERWAAGSSIEEAVVEARLAISGMAAATGRDFATPVLYLRRENRTDAKVAAPAPSAVPDISPVFALLCELRDYKDVHDALHGACMREFATLLRRRDVFPNERTPREFGTVARNLRKGLDEIQRIAEDQRCDAALMDALQLELRSAIGLLEDAVAQSDADTLDDAVAGLESLLATYPVRFDACMSSLAQRLELERTVQFLQSLQLSSAATETAITELRILGEKLRQQAVLHAHCQTLDSKFALINKSPEEQRFREIRRQYAPMAALLAQLLPQWTRQDVDKLREAGERLGAAIEQRDEAAALQAFDDLYNDFDFGFYTVDKDFKAFCAELIDKACHRLQPHQGAPVAS